MPTLHDRENIYRFLWDNTDRHGFIKLSQQEVHKKLNISFQRLSEIYLEFQECNRMKKFANRFQIKNPDSFDWGDEYYEETRKFRASRGR